MNPEKIKHFLMQNSGTILTTMSCAGVLATAYFAAKDALKARDVITELDMQDERDKKTRVAKVIPCYISTALVASTTIAVILGNHKLNAGKIAAYSSAYMLVQTAAKQYRDKVVEVVGEEKAKEIDDKVYDQKLKDHPQDKDVVLVGDGSVLCFDLLTSRYFKSDPEYLRKVVNDMNFEMMANDWVSLNEFYDRVGLEPANLGEFMGWSSLHGQIEIKFSSRLTAENKPCLVIDFYNAPIADTDRRY